MSREGITSYHPNGQFAKKVVNGVLFNIILILSVVYFLMHFKRT